jgi:hypothetical protein
LFHCFKTLIIKDAPVALVVAFNSEPLTVTVHLNQEPLKVNGTGIHPLNFVFVVYLTTLFRYLRLYSVEFYSILIRLPSSSEAGGTRVRNGR